MTDRFPDASLDLAGLPAPDVIQALNYEAILSARLADFKTRLLAGGVDYNVEGSELDPGVVLQQEDAYRELIDLQAINDAAKAVMVRFSYKGNLDNLLALVGVRRRLLTPANNQAVPPTPAVYETDDEFRAWGSMALDGTAPGLTSAGYTSVAMQASPAVRRVSLLRQPGGVVNVVLQGRSSGVGTTVKTSQPNGGFTLTWTAASSQPNNDGSVADAVVAAVAAALNDDWSDDPTTGSQLTDIPQVSSAVVVPYNIAAHFTINRAPTNAAVLAQSLANLIAAAQGLQLTGELLDCSAIIAAGRLAAMVKFTLESPEIDRVCSSFEVPFCTAISVAMTILD